MNHRKFGKKLSRNHNERQALFRSQIRSMFTYGSIETTDAKVKAVAPTIEKLCTVIKKNDLTAKRELYRVLQDSNWVNRVFKTFNEVFATETCNFVKTLNIKRRLGDDALIVRMSFVKPISFIEVKKEDKKEEVKTAPKKVVKKKVVKKVAKKEVQK